jgi:hypothetical protein
MHANETAAAMREMAENAVRLMAKLRMTLDYSEQSVQTVEAYVGELHQFLQSPESAWTDKQKWSFALIFGGYVGEVVRRAAGGEWVAGTLGSDPKLVVGNVELSPATKVLKRMDNGIEDHLAHYVETVLKGIIPAAAGKPGIVVVG